MSRSLDWQEIQRLDRQLCSLGRGDAGLRLRIGELAHEIAERRLFRELGFSRFSYYAIQRSQHGVGWMRESRRVAKALRELPLLRQALLRGELSWSMVELCVRHASLENEASVFERARRSTVRQMRRWFVRMEELPDGDAGGHEESASEVATVDLSELASEAQRLRRRARRRRIPYEEFIAFEATRELASRVAGTKVLDVIVDALLAETETALMNCGGSGFMEIEAELEAREKSWRAWMEERAARDDEVEAEHEEQIATPEPADVVLDDEPLPSTAVGLDRELVHRCTELACRALELGELAQQLCEVDGWRKLGFASLKQFARERMGISLSSLEHKMLLARRVRALPELGEALAEGGARPVGGDPCDTTQDEASSGSKGAVSIGLEVALRLGRVATPQTIGAWLERARKRTVKHLDEEIRAAEMIARNGGGATPPKPPSNEELEAIFEIQRSILSGELLDPTPPEWHDEETRQDAGPQDVQIPPASQWQDDAMTECEKEVGDADESGFVRVAIEPQAAIGHVYGGLVFESRGPSHQKCSPQLSDGPAPAWKRIFRGCGMHTLRLDLSEELWVRWTALEKIHRKVRPADESFLMFMMTAAWASWAPDLPRPFKYKHIHDRDRWMCTSPVCWSRVVTDHHLVRRSRGGTDAEENNTSPCFVCHLDGVHASGWLKVEPPASNMRWTIGLPPTMVVVGRDVVQCGAL